MSHYLLCQRKGLDIRERKGSSAGMGLLCRMKIHSFALTVYVFKWERIQTTLHEILPGGINVAPINRGRLSNAANQLLAFQHPDLAPECGHLSINSRNCIAGNSQKQIEQVFTFWGAFLLVRYKAVFTCRLNTSYWEVTLGKNKPETLWCHFCSHLWKNGKLTYHTVDL